MQIESLKKLKLPDKPGVYFFLKGKEIFYIGKATSLKDRTRSYFAKDLFNTRGPLIIDMVVKASKLDWQETDSVLEALILEAKLIKKHQPYYNTREKDDKSFSVVCITKELFPKVLVFRERNLIALKEENNLKFQAKYGPFTNGGQLREAMKIIRKIFPFLDEKSKNYMEFYKQINLVPDLNNKRMYLQNIRNIKLFFEGKKKQILKNLKKEMAVYSSNQEFEKAGEIKRQIFALQHINDIALIKSGSSSTFRIEAYDIAHLGGKNMVGVMTVVQDGEVNKSGYRKFKIRTQPNANDVGALAEVLKRRMNHPEWVYPDLIVMDGGRAQLNLAQHMLRKMSIKTLVVSVVKDERHKPKAILGNKEFTVKYKREILLANGEAHRFAIAYHKKMRNKNFLG